MRVTVRRGLSLLELLVVISVCLLLLSILLPAVQKVRDAAARLSCKNNLRQIGLATLNYESATGRLPPAYRPRSARVSEPFLQWPLLIASYLELDANQRAAEADFRRSSDPFLPTPHRGLDQPLKPFICPSDARVTQSWDVEFLYTLARPRPVLMKQTVALNSYLGNAGTTARQRDGTIVADGRLTILSVTDGTSNTLAFGERPPPTNLQHGWLYIGWGVGGYGTFDSVLGVREWNLLYSTHKSCGPGPFPYRQPELNTPSDCAQFQFWSLHNGGANFALCDGSVRFLTYSTDAVLPALATRAGGEVTQAPD